MTWLYFIFQKELPTDKPRIMHSVWRPDILLDAIEQGLDIFDSSYPLLTNLLSTTYCQFVVCQLLRLGKVIPKTFLSGY